MIDNNLLFLGQTYRLIAGIQCAKGAGWKRSTTVVALKSCWGHEGKRQRTRQTETNKSSSRTNKVPAWKVNAKTYSTAFCLPSYQPTHEATPCPYTKIMPLIRLLMIMLITYCNVLSVAVQFSDERSRLWFACTFYEQLCIYMQLHVMLNWDLVLKHAFLTDSACHVFSTKNLLTSY